MFEITQNILERTEAQILEIPSENKLWGLFTRYMIFPFKYLALGLKDFFKPSTFWAFSSFLLLILGSALASELNLQSQQKLIILNVCLYLPMVIVIFSIPSTYSYSGVQKKYVQKVSDLIEKEGIKSIDEVKLLEENIDQIYFRVTSRISFYKLLITAGWAIYMVFFNIEIRHFMKNDQDSLNQALSGSLTTFAVVFIGTIGAMLLIIGYKRASEVLIKTIKFGCVEYKFKLLKNA